VLICLTMFWVACEVVARYVFMYSFEALVDTVILFTIVVAFLSLSTVQQNNAHIRIDLLDNKLSKGRAGFIVQCLVVALSAMVVAVTCYITARYALATYVLQRVTIALYWPFWPFAALIPIGLFLLMIRLGIQLKGVLEKHS